MLFIFDSVRFEPFQQLLYFNTSRKCQPFKSGDHPPEAWVRLRFLPLKRNILLSATDLR